MFDQLTLGLGLRQIFGGVLGHTMSHMLLGVEVLLEGLDYGQRLIVRGGIFKGEFLFFLVRAVMAAAAILACS